MLRVGHISVVVRCSATVLFEFRVLRDGFRVAGSLEVGALRPVSRHLLLYQIITSANSKKLYPKRLEIFVIVMLPVIFNMCCFLCKLNPDTGEAPLGLRSPSFVVVGEGFSLGKQGYLEFIPDGGHLRLRSSSPAFPSFTLSKCYFH